MLTWYAALYIQGTGFKPVNSSTTILSGTSSCGLAPGPYFINAAGSVYEAWRLYSDVQGAFTESAIANGDGSYSVLPAGTVGQKHAIAVPSRLYFKKTVEKPLAGMRIGIKDIYGTYIYSRENLNLLFMFFSQVRLIDLQRLKICLLLSASLTISLCRHQGSTHL